MAEYELPIIPFSRDFMQYLAMDDAAVYALKPVFAARCERLTTTNRYLERAVIITQGGRLLLFEMNRDEHRITHQLEIGTKRPHKKLILEVDSVPDSSDKQTVRIITEPLTPREKEQYNRFDRDETEEEFQARLQQEAAERGELTPDVDIILSFHCGRAPIATQFVSIIRHFALPHGDFYVELQTKPITAKCEQPFYVSFKNIFKAKKENKRDPVFLECEAHKEKVQLEEQGEVIQVLPPVQAPRQGGLKKPSESTLAEEVKFGVTEKLVEEERRKLLIAQGVPKSQVYCDDDDYIEDHLPEYNFDYRDPEYVETVAKRLKRSERPPMPNFSGSESEGEIEKKADSDDDERRELKVDKKKQKEEQKKLKKKREKEEKKRKEAEERDMKKREKMLTQLAMAKRESGEGADEYRYPNDFAEQIFETTHEALYRTRKNKPGALFVIRAPHDEEALALTSLCFYRRNVIAYLNPLIAADDSETTSLAITSSGQLILCQPTLAEQDENDVNPTVKGFPAKTVKKVVVEFSNHFVNNLRSGYVILTVDTDPKRKKKKKKKKEPEYGNYEYPEDEIYANMGRDEDGNTPQDLRSRDEQMELRSQNEFGTASNDGSVQYNAASASRAPGAQDEDDDDDFEITERIVEFEFDDECCGDMSPEDAECSSLEYFTEVLRSFNKEVVVVVKEPPPEEPEPFYEPEPIVELDTAQIPSGAARAAKLVHSAANRAKALASSTSTFQAPIHDVIPDTRREPPSVPAEVNHEHESLIRQVSKLSTLPLTPEDIKKRGDDLRRMISDHKKSGKWQDSDENKSPADAEAIAERKKLGHRALTQLIFEITNNQLLKQELRHTQQKFGQVGLSSPLSYSSMPRSSRLR